MLKLNTCTVLAARFAVTATSCYASPRKGAFIEENGLVVIEAESINNFQ